MLLYTGSFILSWIVPVIILSTPLKTMPAFRIVSNLLAPLQGLFSMVIFFRPQCVKYRRDNPGTSLLVAYVNVVLMTSPLVENVIRMFSPLQATTPNTNDDEDIDEGIGYRRLHEESPHTQEASG